MCGRVKLEGDFSQLKAAFNIPDDYPAPNYAPSWNVAPTDSLPIVRYNAKEGHRSLDLMRCENDGGKICHGSGGIVPLPAE
jgi:putative SOS response-associated peptidase YedK